MNDQKIEEWKADLMGSSLKEFLESLMKKHKIVTVVPLSYDSWQKVYRALVIYE